MKATFDIPNTSFENYLPVTASSNEFPNLTATATVIAKLDPSLDVIFQMQKAYNNFIDSGQGWALLIGFFLGYFLRSLTAS